MRGKKDFKGSLFFAHAGDIIFSKIDVRNGAIGIIPSSVPIATVTSEFPVYRIRKDIALPEYIQLVFRTRHFRAIISGMISGASGRKRVQPDQLETVEIPLPSIGEQRAIVDRWHKAETDIDHAHKRVEKLRTAIQSRFLQELGLTTSEPRPMPKAFALWWDDLNRWGVASNLLKMSALDLSRGAYPILELGTLVDVVQYGTSEKANTTGNGFTIIRMNNIVDGELDLKDLKHVCLPLRDAERLLLKDGDILFNRTNSKELVGKCAVFHAQGDFVFASYLIRVRTDAKKADPDFLSYVINSSVGRQQINALSRQIIGQANVNSEELRSLRIPLPPLPVQKQIMQRVTAGCINIAHERQFAMHLSDAITSEIEGLIVGSGKADGL